MKVIHAFYLKNSLGGGVILKNVVLSAVEIVFCAHNV